MTREQLAAQARANLPARRRDVTRADPLAELRAATPDHPPTEETA